MNKEEVVPQWCSDITPAWFDDTPWLNRQSVIDAAKRFADEGIGIRLAGIWRVQEFK